MLIGHPKALETLYIINSVNFKKWKKVSLDLWNLFLDISTVDVMDKIESTIQRNRQRRQKGHDEQNRKQNDRKRHHAFMHKLCSVMSFWKRSLKPVVSVSFMIC